ncbi:hypothetical protein [Parvularcula marina]|uniref:Uncharacterized protein n=1 Tax=Parvularcula marina TaxID=2292771 RepID=A0A371R7S0_9PROT|nr:hypothetical protein [Parvularcula marina]RFB01487.1 hypothetical protein DX908_14460 [Parvularcula marina]
MGITAIGWITILFGGMALAACLMGLRQMQQSRRPKGASIQRVSGRVLPIETFYAPGSMDRAAAAAEADLGVPEPLAPASFAPASIEEGDLSIAARLTTGAVGTAVATIALDTATVGLDPEDRRLKPMLTELVDVRRPAEVSDLFAGGNADSVPGMADEFLVEIRRAVIRAYRSTGKGACLVVPVTGQPGMFFDLRIERYSRELADVCHEMFEVLGEIVDWSDAGDANSTPVRYAALPQAVPALLRSLRTAVRDLQLPPAFDYIRGEIDAYAGAMSGRVDAQNVMQIVNRYGRLDLKSAGIAPDAKPPARLLCLVTLIAVWDALILNFGFSEEVTTV